MMPLFASNAKPYPDICFTPEIETTSAPAGHEIPVSCETAPGSTRIVWNLSSPQSLVFQRFPNFPFSPSLRRVEPLNPANRR